MEEILKEIEEYAYYDLTQEQRDKLQGDPTLGGKIEIKWKDREYTDYGYAFQIPECDEDPDMQDFIIHVPKPDNSDGIDEATPVWVHLNSLLSNKRVKWVKCN